MLLKLEDGTYISRWPDRSAGGSYLKNDGPLSSIFTASTMQNRTYDDDKFAEHKSPDYQVAYLTAKTA